MEQCQRAGDKSEELSVRTDTMSVRTTDNLDDSLLELAPEEDDPHTDDDDATSVSDNDDNVSYGDTLSYVEEEEEGLEEDDLAYNPQQRNQRSSHRNHNTRMEEPNDIEDDGEGSEGVDDLSGYGGAEFHREEAESFLRELMSSTCHGTQRIHTEQHQDSLRQLNSKWQHILDQVIDEQEQHIESLVADRNERDLRSAAEVNGLRQRHEEELAAVKEEVMEQSQKIILQEMKVNAERERKYEEEFESRVETAVEETKQQLSEEFDSTMKSMKHTQEEMKDHYERLLNEAEIRIQDDVKRDAETASDSKVSVFMSQYEEMKAQVVDMTMDIQTLEMTAETREEEHAIEIAEKDKEITKLKANIDKRISTQKLLVSQMRDTHKSELEKLQEELSMLLSEKHKRDTNASMVEDGSDANFGKDLTMAKAKITELERFHAEHKKRLDDEHSKAIQDLKKAHEVKMEQMLATESKNSERMQKALNKIHKNELAALRKQIEEGTAAMDKYEASLKKEKSKMSALKKEHDISIQKLKREHKVKLERTNASASLAAQKSAKTELNNASKVRFEERMQTLQKQHKHEMDTLKEQMKEGKAGMTSKYDSIISELKIKSASLQALNDELTKKSKVKESKMSKTVTGLEAKVLSLQKQNNKLYENLISAKKETGDAMSDANESKGALASLQRDVEEMKHAANMRSISMNDKKNLFLNGSDSMLQNSSKTNRQEASVTAKVNVESDKQNPERTTLPKEIQVESEELDGDEQIPDTISNCSTVLSSGQDSQMNLSYRNTRSSSDLSPITFGSPTPKRKSWKKNSRVAPSTRTSVHGTKKKLEMKISPSSSSSKPAFRTNVSPSSATTPTAIVAPKSLRKFLTTPRMRRRDSFSSWGSSLTQMEPEDIRLMVLNAPITPKLKKIAKFFKVELIDDPLQATHVIAGDASHPMRRTWKLMTAFCRTSIILKAEWLEESYKSKELLSYKRFLLLNDSLAESVYSFSMKSTLREGNERRRDGGLLAGWRILISDNVAGNRAPKEKELQTIISAAGGVAISKDDIPLPPTDDPTHVIVITSDPPLPVQVQDSKCQVAAANGAGFFTTTWFFDCMMHQKLFGIRRGLGRM